MFGLIQPNQIFRYAYGSSANVARLLDGHAIILLVTQFELETQFRRLSCLPFVEINLTRMGALGGFVADQGDEHVNKVDDTSKVQV